MTGWKNQIEATIVRARSKRIVPETAKIRANNAVGEKESRLIERCFAECSRYSENRVIFLVSFYERHIDRACGRWQRRIERAIAAPRSRASIVDKLFTKTNRTKNEKERERERERVSRNSERLERTRVVSEPVVLRSIRFIGREN